MLGKDHRYKAMLEWENGKVLIIEAPTPIHENTISKFAVLIDRALGDSVEGGLASRMHQQ